MAIYIFIYKYTVFKYLLRTDNCQLCASGILTSHTEWQPVYIYTVSYHFFGTDESLFGFDLLLELDTSSSDSFFQSSSLSFSRFFSLYSAIQK